MKTYNEEATLELRAVRQVVRRGNPSGVEPSRAIHWYQCRHTHPFLLVLQEIAVSKVLNISENQAGEIITTAGVETYTSKPPLAKDSLLDKKIILYLFLHQRSAIAKLLWFVTTFDSCS